MSGVKVSGNVLVPLYTPGPVGGKTPRLVGIAIEACLVKLNWNRSIVENHCQQETEEQQILFLPKVDRVRDGKAGRLLHYGKMVGGRGTH